jgi:hypothetical protein
MPFDPDLRQHKIETAGFRIDGDYSHAIPSLQNNINLFFF